MREYLFSSESVSVGHPDKVADQISDAILDAYISESIRQNKSVDTIRCACETMVKTGLVIVSGEIRAEVKIDIEKVVRATIRDIGYDTPGRGFDADSCAVINTIGEQSPDIAQGVDKKKKIGAGDQGLMFGYACKENTELMPQAIRLAHQLMQKHAQVRRRQLPWLGPDAKAQVTLKYVDGKPQRQVEKVVLSSQHDDKIGNRQVTDNDKRIRQGILDKIILPVIGKKYLPKNDNILINPTGRFVDGGPKADCGLTGRKIIVDTYGGAAPHGGGAFSGKDPTKVDRSAAYMARYIAKNIVAAGLASRCQIQVAYAIGVTEPVSVMVDTFGTHRKDISDTDIEKIIARTFNLTPVGIINHLQLWRPIYQQTAAHGHFGRQDKNFTWEQTDKVTELKKHLAKLTN